MAMVERYFVQFGDVRAPKESAIGWALLLVSLDLPDPASRFGDSCFYNVKKSPPPLSRL